VAKYNRGSHSDFIIYLSLCSGCVANCRHRPENRVPATRCHRR